MKIQKSYADLELLGENDNALYPELIKPASEYMKKYAGITFDPSSMEHRHINWLIRITLHKKFPKDMKERLIRKHLNLPYIDAIS